MKICPKCNTGNSDNALQCKDCGTYFGVTNVTEDSQIIDEFNRKEKRKETIKKSLKILVIAFVIVCYVIFFIRASSKGDFLQITFLSLLSIGLGYLNIFHPEVLFKIKYFTEVKNIEYVEPSDLYLYSSRFTGILLLVVGIFILFFLCGFFHVGSN